MTKSNVCAVHVDVEADTVRRLDAISNLDAITILERSGTDRPGRT
jgi:hypothetical protein